MEYQVIHIKADDLTATGIAPDLHRTSLLIPIPIIIEAGTKFVANVGESSTGSKFKKFKVQRV
jgi:hypothetical protein